MRLYMIYNLRDIYMYVRLYNIKYYLTEGLKLYIIMYSSAYKIVFSLDVLKLNRNPHRDNFADEKPLDFGW